MVSPSGIYFKISTKSIHFLFSFHSSLFTCCLTTSRQTAICRAIYKKTIRTDLQQYGSFASIFEFLYSPFCMPIQFTALKPGQTTPPSLLQSFRITDPTDAALVLSILEGKDPDYSLNRDPVMQEDQLADQTEPGMYLLTLCKPDGSQRHYRIDGREVFCQTTAEAFSLTDQQANDLYKFLTQLSEEN